MKVLVSVLSLVASAALSWAEPQQFTFALPEMEGRISLGIFDGGNKLVRTLSVNAAISDFKIGLNGLIATWDGNDDAGKPLPAGKYMVRGYVVGTGLKSEGEAFHFNDWVESEETAQLLPRAVFWAGGDTTYLAAASDAILQYTENDGLKLLDGYPEAYRQFKIARLDNIAKVANESGLSANVVLSDANASAFVISDKKSVWVARKDKFELVPFEGGLEIESLSAGMGETFWIKGRGAGGAAFVRQYAFDGQILRELTSEVEAAGTIFADKSQERIFLSQELPEKMGGMIRGLQATGPAVANGTADWEIFLEKRTEDCTRFGLVDGKLVANAGDALQNDSQKIVMAASSLAATMQSVSLQVTALGGEVWLQTADGLRLSLVGKLPGASRCVVRPEGGNSLRAFAGNGIVVAEYRIIGLKQLAEIDAGEIDLP